MLNLQWTTDQPLPDDFFDIAMQVYADNPFWIPENKTLIRQQFSETNAYFDHAQAQVFLVPDCARLVAFYNPHHLIENEQVAYFGFWETQDDLEANTKLFAEFERWASDQGAQRVYGPINFSTYGENRLRIDGFENKPFIGEPANPSYYPDFLKQLGYDTKYGYASFIHEDCRSLAVQMQAPLNKALQHLQDNSLGPFSIEKLDGKAWMNNLDQLYPLVDMIFKQNFAYTPITESNFRTQCGESFAKKLCPNTSVLVRDEQGDIAGFFLVYPDYSELVNQSGSGISVGDINYNEHFPLLSKPRLALAKTGGIHPKYRSSGLFTIMSMQLTVWSQEYYEHISGAMVREDNHSIHYAKVGPVERHYALFEKAL
ncbi:hypothetical protein ACU6U9_03545 [Pseudomonas sp. HK3]